MAFDAATLMTLAATDKMSGLSFRGIEECLAAQSAQHNFVSVSIIIADGSGGFWGLVVDQFGNIGTIPVAGPATANVVLDDGVGGFWLIVVDAMGNRGTTPTVGPATNPVPVLQDGFGGNWQLVVDSSGNLGALSV